MSATMDYLNGAVNDANTGLSIYKGITSGKPLGQARAGLTAAKTFGKLTGSSGLNTGATGALDALSIYQGLQRGGVQGYGQAAGSGLRLAGMLSNNPALATAGGYIMAPLAVYNAVNNWQSGKTGSNALNGAEAGAAIGSIIPGVGTLIGGLVGGAVGALSSAFGPGAKDPETTSVQGLLDYTGSHGNDPRIAQQASNPYLELAGLMDRRGSTLPMYQQYGRMGEQKFSNDLAGQINQAFTGGIGTGAFQGDKWSKDASGNYVLTTPTGGKTIYKPEDAAAEVYATTVDPWVSKMGQGYSNVGDTYKATTQGLLQDMTGQYLSGQAAQNWKAVGGDSPFQNIYAGSPFTAAPTAPVPQASTAGSGMRQGAKMVARGGRINYDDGGDVSIDDAGAASPDWQPQLQDISQEDVNTALDQANYGPGYDPYSIVNAYNDPYAYGAGDSGGSGSSGGLAGLGSLLQGLGLSGSTLNSIAPYAALLPLLQSALGGNKGAQAPGVPSQYSGPLLNMQTPPAFNRQQNPIQMTQDQWLHSAEGPELDFYSGNQLPITPMSAPNAAQMTSSPYSGAQANPYNVVGGNVMQQAPTYAPPNMNTQPVGIGGPGMRPIMMSQGGLAHLGQGGTTFDSTGSGLGGLGHVKGPGDGTSDSIQLKNAYLSNGEYVIDAPTVSMAGNGSNDAGAKVFDRIRQDIRKHGGKALAKGKQPMTAKQINVANYMGGGR